MIKEINIIHYLLTENVNQVKEIRESIQKEFEYLFSIQQTPDFVLKAKKNQLNNIDLIIQNLNNQIDVHFNLINDIEMTKELIKTWAQLKLDLFTLQYDNIIKSLEVLKDATEKPIKLATKPFFTIEQLKNMAQNNKSFLIKI